MNNHDQTNPEDSAIERPSQTPLADSLTPTAVAEPSPQHWSSRMRASVLNWRMIPFLLLAVLSIPVWRAVTSHANVDGRHAMSAPAPAVAVAKVTRENLVQELVCDGELRPYQEIEMHAKVAGYLQELLVDIGDRVKAGQLLATIEVPELQDDITGAEATLRRKQEEVAHAAAVHEEANLIYTRLTAVNNTRANLVAQQELDGARAKHLTTASALSAAQAQVEVARAELKKLQTMLKYCRITAPFAGVITRRYADPGALIQAGTSSSTQALPLVRISQNDRLRLNIPVSVTYVPRIHVGDSVDILIESLGQDMDGTIARCSRKIETATRTMEVEVDIENADLRLIPGMYASVAFRLEHREDALAVPVEAVSRAKACTVILVTARGQAEERNVQLGLETPRKIEVLAGLRENDLVMIGSRGRIKPGQIVEPKLITSKTPE